MRRHVKSRPKGVPQPHVPLSKADGEPPFDSTVRGVGKLGPSLVDMGPQRWRSRVSRALPVPLTVEEKIAESAGIGVVIGALRSLAW